MYSYQVLKANYEHIIRKNNIDNIDIDIYNSYYLFREHLSYDLHSISLKNKYFILKGNDNKKEIISVYITSCVIVYLYIM